MSAKLFEAALGIADPWFIRGVDFDAARKTLTIGVDFVAGSRFPVPGIDGAHPVHDTVTKRKARGYGRFSTIRTVIFLLTGKLDFSRFNPHAA